MQSAQQKPIGIFDSGIGGLTVMRAVRNLLPHEDIIYFGDTAHLPYGDKSTEAIQSYSIKIANFLLSQECKVILIACNSASAAAYKLLKEYVGSKASVLNVIDPMVSLVAEKYAGKIVGLIGTKQTVHSNVYAKKINDLQLGITLKSLATPLLVPMIEEGYLRSPILQQTITDYLSRSELSDIEALILGCTHYPLIRPEIEAFYQGKVAILDSSEVVARSLRGLLELKNIANPQQKTGKSSFFVSDYTQSFENATFLFFGENVRLEHYPLWE
ncbi:glutamate racemase [Raineya orbicola]|jgi:glutamate racemase|uniref:Glutamate racemase n=1 Tax=Raineya orbicola TaxID=2016530 RepID=A0A2N3I8F2_9BACT|nr:glutamate racemase [Raineya orbicola]PKQ66596.1 Glutamate racemase [Raineya orbicola]